ncbi:MAG: hypothetical protein KJI72_00185 [Patescibacteria group bacterium]|nr:hypothetical protein [Patescibacteria group bacterium]
MDEEQKRRAHQALKEIEDILKGVTDLYPIYKEAVAEGEKGSGLRSLRILKKVSGIIKNYSMGNADLKLGRLMDFFGSIITGKARSAASEIDQPDEEKDD